MRDLKDYPVSAAEVVRARPVVQRFLKPTPLTRYEGLSRALGAEMYVKHENHHPTGCFKIRGAVNLLHQLKERDVRGVVTFSTGNHGLAIATAARWFGLSAVVVVPEGNNPVKNRAIRETDAELVEAGHAFEASAATAETLSQERRLYYAHPADEPFLINGVGTEFLEILEDLPDIDVVIVPIGAGSEAAAAVTVLRPSRPDVAVFAVQAESSPAAFRSWREKRLCTAKNETFAGGLATGTGYRIPFDVYAPALDDFVLLTEQELYESIGLAFHYTHNLAEAAGAAPLMAALKLRERLKGKNVVLQMSGCNASPDEIARAVACRSFREGFEAF